MIGHCFIDNLFIAYGCFCHLEVLWIHFSIDQLLVILNSEQSSLIEYLYWRCRYFLIHLPSKFNDERVIE